MKSLKIPALLALFTATMFAFAGGFYGDVTKAVSGAPLQYGTVHIWSTTSEFDTTIGTTAAGGYWCGNLDDGEYKLEAYKVEGDTFWSSYHYTREVEGGMTEVDIVVNKNSSK